MSKLEKVISNLRESLAAAEYLEIGGQENRIVWLYPRELEALIGLADSLMADPYVMHAGRGHSEVIDKHKDALVRLEACAYE